MWCSLQTEHFGVFAGLIWTWILAKKFQIEDGLLKGAVDNMTVVNRINEVIDMEAGHTQHLATDYDVWVEIEQLLSKVPVKISSFDT